MEMCDALMIGGTQHWGGGDDIFGIGIAYGLQGSELSLESGVAVDKPKDRWQVIVPYVDGLNMQNFREMFGGLKENV